MKKVILGATGSIGSSLAKKLVDSGEQVHLVGRNENSLSELAKNLNSTFTVCDVLEENFSEKILNDLEVNDRILSNYVDCLQRHNTQERCQREKHFLDYIFKPDY